MTSNETEPILGDFHASNSYMGSTISYYEATGRESSDHDGQTVPQSRHSGTVTATEGLRACEGATFGPRGHPSLQESVHQSVCSMRGSLRHSLVLSARKSFRLSGRPVSVRDMGGNATVMNETCNLIKNIVGCGVLSIPCGISAFANAPSAIFPASILILITGAICGYFFHLLGRVCRVTQTATYREAWEQSIGESGSLIVALVNTLKAALGNLAYSMILGNLVRDILKTAGIITSRSVAILAVTVVVLLPLCMFKNLKVLAPFSIIGLAGMLFTGVSMGIRYFDGTYRYGAGKDGKFLVDLKEEMKPSFGNKGAQNAFTPQVLVLACMLFESFVAHYNAPRYYIELKRNTVQRFASVTVFSFGISAAFFIMVAAFGFLTFGESCSGLILDNYSAHDTLATLSRISLSLAIAFTYPILFIGVRDGIIDILMVPSELQTAHNLNVLSVLLLVILTVLAVMFTDLGLVSAIGGGTLATATVFIFPALMFYHTVKDRGDKAAVVQKVESNMSLVLMCLGIIMGVIGVLLAVQGK